MDCRSPTAAAARTRRDASPGDSRNVDINMRTIFGWVSTSGRFRRSASATIRWSANGIRFRIRSKSWVNVTNSLVSMPSRPPSSAILTR